MHKTKENASNEDLDGKIMEEGKEQRTIKDLRGIEAREGRTELQ